MGLKKRKKVKQKYVIRVSAASHSPISNNASISPYFWLSKMAFSPLERLEKA
jgi:hypothetical protein